MENFIKALKETIPEIKETGTKEVGQAGVYIYFDALNPEGHNKDKMTCQLVIAGNSLTGNPKAIMPVIVSIRERLREAANSFNGSDIFKGVQAVSVTGSLFVYAMAIEIIIYNEVLREAML